MKLWQFTPIDSCFFRGANPFNAGEGGFLDSQFPPTAQTMAGVIRSTIADTMQVDWAKLHNNEQTHISGLIGTGVDDPGRLKFNGSYIIKNKQRLFPVPLHLLYNEQKEKWGMLEPSKEMFITDQGEMHLPQVMKGSPEAAKPLTNAWLDVKNFTQVLQGSEPSTFYTERDLFKTEPRTGIGRDNSTRIVEEGKLYFTRHIRLAKDVTLAMVVEGADDIKPAKMLRLGGEGRMAALDYSDSQSLLPKRQGIDGKSIIILLTHGDFNGKNAPPLPKGLKIISACLGKAVHEGGWDYKECSPKPLRSLVPAGSVYFVKGDTRTLASHIGERTAFGYGEIAIGIRGKS